MAGEPLLQHDNPQDGSLLASVVGGLTKDGGRQSPQAVRCFSFDQANGRIDALALSVH